MNSADKFTGPVNLGNPVEITINELAEAVIKYTKSKSKISYEQLPKDDPKRRKPNISVANKKLHWQPNVGLELGLKKTIEFFKNE